MPELPVYVAREHDAKLAVVAADAAAGRSRMTVLVGGSSTGKTRACWEALQPLREAGGWRLWHPIDPDRPDAALAGLSRIGPRTVVWLNESQLYLLTGDPLAGSRVAAGLRELLRDPRRAPVLVLGTIRLQYWRELSAAPGRDGRDPHAHARELLTGRYIVVPAAFTGTALVALEAAARADPRLAAARKAPDGQVTQFLAGVPVLMDRYRTAPTVTKAVIDAALDTRMLGHGPAIPRALLEAAAPGYLTSQQWEEDDDGEGWLERALADITPYSHGVPGPLTRIRPRPGQPASGQSHYRLAEYLEQAGHIGRPAGAARLHSGRPSSRTPGGKTSPRSLTRHDSGGCTSMPSGSTWLPPQPVIPARSGRRP